MRKIYLVAILLFINMHINAQLTGLKSIPGDYPTIASAVTAVNTQGVGSGGVTFNIAAGFTETISAIISLEATGTAANPIIFQKIGAGLNPLITAYAGTNTSASSVQDGIWRLVGSDYVTIKGIDLYDPNISNPATMEYGYALYKANVNDGAQNNTIINCVITLNRVNNASGSGPSSDGSRGIEIVNAIPTDATTALSPTSAAGANSNNKIYSSTIENCNIGIALVGFYGFSPPYSMSDFNNDIGGTSSFTGNTIINFGGGGSASPSYGVLSSAQYNLNVSNNTINNNNGTGLNHTNELKGINIKTVPGANVKVKNNQVTLAGGGTTSGLTAIDIYYFIMSLGGVSDLFEINNNLISNCTYGTATTGNFYGIRSLVSGSSISINNNSISNCSLSGSGDFYGALSSGNLNMNNNTVSNIQKTGEGGMISCLGMTGSVGVISDNMIDNISIPATSGISSGKIYGINSSASSVGETFNNNSISNLFIGGASTSVGHIIYGINSIPAPIPIGGKTKSLEFTNNGNRTNSSASVKNIFGNVIQQLTVNTTGGSGSTFGIYSKSGSNVSLKMNKIGNLISGGFFGASAGFHIDGGHKVSIVNNIIGDLQASAADDVNAVNGIYISGSSTTDTVHAHYNTVFINGSSSAANFGSSGLCINSGPFIELKNNLVVNNSIPKGTGFAVAYRRTSAALTTYGAGSNNNLFYSGVPSASRLIFHDGTNSDMDLANFKSRVSPRDALSVTENVTFLSTTVSSSDFLHINPAVFSFAESGGVNISGVSIDFDNQVRQGNPGYSGTGNSPDIGADEFNGMLPPNCSGTPIAGIVSATPATINCSGSTTLNSAGASSGAGIYYNWEASVDGGTTWVSVASTSSYNTNLSSTTQFRLRVTCVASSLSDTSNIVTVTVDPISGGIASASSTSVCEGVDFTLSLTGATTSGVDYQWQYSHDGTNFNNVASGGTGATYVTNQTVPTFYRALVTCIPGGTTVSSVSIQITMKPPTQCYCTNNLHTGAGPCISSVVLNTLNNNTGSVCALPSYTSFDPTSFTTTVKAGNIENLALITSSSAITSVWIDYNQNGLFESSEWTQIYTSGTSGNVNITIPVSALPGQTGMRIRSASSGSTNGASNACTTFTSGETEDYIITILPPDACTVPPTGGTTNVNIPLPACANTPFILSVSGASSGAGLTYQWQSSPTGSVWSDISGETGLTFLSNTGITATTYYRRAIICSGNTQYSSPLAVTVSPINTVPYFEGFEALTVMNTLPPCMSATNLGSKVQTYLATPAAPVYNRMARNGNKFASFATNPGTDGQWIFTPAIQLTAGVFYKFSAWHITDGAAGFDAIQGFFGTEQNPAGMTEFIVSKSNPTNTVYEDLTSDFTPSVSGIYYFGILVKGTSAVPKYLTVDDISIMLTAPVPVTLSDLKGERLGAVNKLSWNTLTEFNNKGFEIQKSGDGINFSTIKYKETKASNGNSNANLSYEISDEKPFSGNNYYRLKQVDLDGKFNYSNIVLIKGLKTGSITINSIYPNPVKNKLNMVISASINQKVNFIISDISGRIMLNQSSHLLSGDNTVSFELYNIPAGSYFIKAVCANGCETAVKKFVKQ